MLSRIHFMVLAAGWFCAFAGPQCLAQVKTLRVLSYNVHHCQGVDGKLDVERIAGVIRSTKPDLVALQEVDRNTKRTQGVDQAQRLADLTKMHMAFGANIKLQGGEYGNAVLSKWPIKSSTNHKLPNHRDGEQRGLLEVRIQLKPGVEFSFCSTHFDHRQDPSERIASAERVNTLLGQLGDRVILAGDLNDVHNSEMFRELQRFWRPANTQPLPTIPVDNPTRQIDFVLIPKRSTWRATGGVVQEKIASDHRPLVILLNN